MKKIIALMLIMIILLAPIFSFTYYEEEVGLTIKKQSLVKTFVDTIKDGTY